MLAVAARGLLRYVIRATEVYLVPRSNGRVLIGSTLENAGFDKRVDAATLQRLHQAAANLVPQIGEARILEDWTGLRPGTPDDLPLLGRTDMEGYCVAAGHYRNGILLAPITALVMTELVRGRVPEFDLAPFSPMRFT
jgi:glycine oxidase